MFKKQVHLPLTHAERINSALAAFHQAKQDIAEVQLDIEDEITVKQKELSDLNARHQEASDALKRISAITG